MVVGLTVRTSAHRSHIYNSERHWRIMTAIIFRIGSSKCMCRSDIYWTEYSSVTTVAIGNCRGIVVLGTVLRFHRIAGNQSWHLSTPHACTTRLCRLCNNSRCTDPHSLMPSCDDSANCMIRIVEFWGSPKNHLRRLSKRQSTQANPPFLAPVVE